MCQEMWPTIAQRTRQISVFESVCHSAFFEGIPVVELFTRIILSTFVFTFIV